MVVKSIHFLIGDQNAKLGSVYLRAIQLRDIVSMSLHSFGLPSFVSNRIEEIADSIVIVNKSAMIDFSPANLSSLRRQNNIVLIDPIDVHPSRIVTEYCDYIVSSSKTQTNYLRQCHPDMRIYYVPHHVDLRMKEKDYGLSIKQLPKCAYFGLNFNCLFLDEIKSEIDFFSVWQYEQVDWLNQLQNYNIHYGLRANQDFDGFKPFTKGFIAAMQKSVIILSDDDQEAAMHVGSAYPFRYNVLNPSQALEAIKDVKSAFRTPRWYTALEIMGEVKALSSNGRVIDTFMQMVGDLV